jgi:hydrogenase/urease accessory protein HupE
MTPHTAVRAAAGGACLWLAAAQPALAHVAIEGADDFTAGLLHPFFVLSHMLVIVGLGLLLGQQDFTRVRLALAAFVAALLAGFAAAAIVPGAAVPVDGVLLATAVSVGLLVALARGLPPIVTAGLALVVGAAVGFDSFPEAGPVWSRLAGVTGTALSVCILLVNVLAAVGYLTRDWQRIGVRVVGSWIGACALMVGALAMR